MISIPSHLIYDTPHFNTETSKRDEAPIHFSTAYFEKIAVTHKNCGFFDCVGEAMKPTIDGECLLLIDFEANKLQEGKIYLLEIGTRLMVRRVQLLLDRIILVADNPEYQNIEIPGDGLNHLKVRGQIRFMGKIF